MNLIEIDIKTANGLAQWSAANPAARWCRVDDPKLGDVTAVIRRFIDMDAPPADTPLNFRTRIHLAPNGEVQYVHLEKDGQVIGLTIEQATSLAKEITSRLGLTRP